MTALHYAVKLWISSLEKFLSRSNRIPCSVNGVGPQMQMRTLDLSELLFKNSERRAGEMCPHLPFHSEVGAERTNSTSNLEERNIF